MTFPALDDLDARLLRVLADSPRATIVDLARRLGVARATAQARLEKLVQRGVVAGFGPQLGLRALGYEVMAFTTLDIAQGALGDVLAHLKGVPEVLEAHAVSGPGDLHCRVVARSNAHLHEVLTRILGAPGITRTSTVVALSEQIPYSALGLVQSPAASATTSRSDATLGPWTPARSPAPMPAPASASASPSASPPASSA